MLLKIGLLRVRNIMYFGLFLAPWERGREFPRVDEVAERALSPRPLDLGHTAEAICPLLKSFQQRSRKIRQNYRLLAAFRPTKKFVLLGILKTRGIDIERKTTKDLGQANVESLLRRPGNRSKKLVL